MPTQDLALAHDLLRRRSFDQAAALYLAAINDGGEPPAWEGLLTCLAGLGMADKALALVETRQQRCNDGLTFYFHALARAVANGFADLAGTLVTGTPDNSLLYVVARYFAGVIDIHQQRPREAAGHFSAAGVMAQNLSAHFWPDPYLRKIIIEGPLFEDFQSLDRLIARDRADVVAEAGVIAPIAEFHDPGGTGAPFVACAGMNETYLDRFGARAVSAMAAALASIPDATFHLHVVDPTPALREKIDRLRERAPALRLGVSTETYRHQIEGYGRAEYYACARFLRAPEIMAHYRKPLLIVDADIAKLAHAPHIMTRFGDASYGCFEQRWQFPSNVCHASTVVVGANASAHRFADLTAKLIARRVVSHPFWMLDQLSLLVASRYLMISDSDFRALDLAEATGLPFDACFISDGDAEEKQSMRKAVVFSPATAAPSA
jgi:hypothetical protein